MSDHNKGLAGGIKTLKIMWNGACGVSPMAINKMRKKRKTIFASVVIIAIVLSTYTQLMKICSTSKSRKFINDMCHLHKHGKVAGNMCSKLCDEDKLTFSHCANGNGAKFVFIMNSADCGPSGMSADVVMKSGFGLDHWTQDNEVFFSVNESPKSMINRSKTVINRKYYLEYGVDLLKQNDSLSYIWQQDFYNYVNVGEGVEDFRRRTSVGLQSILALIKQKEYGSILMLNHMEYIPQLYGSCGPAFFVEYTPSFPYLGYVLFQGKLKQVWSLTPKLLSWPSWADRARVALELLHSFKHIDHLQPPVYMCDIRPQNFGISMQNTVKILDIDSIKVNQIASNDTVCHSDSDCSFGRCEGRCNFSDNTCLHTPQNSHLQDLCRYVFLSDVTMFGLLRRPPTHVRDKLGEILRECTSPNKSKVISGHSDELMYKKLVEILHRSLT